MNERLPIVPSHQYGPIVADILIARGDFAADWWDMVQPRILAHQKMGTAPSELADLFSESWKVIRETGGWKGKHAETVEDRAMRTTLNFCAVARRHGCS